MYVPSACLVSDTEKLCDFIQSHSFAILTSLSTDSEAPPVATHLPLLPEMENEQPVRLIGHMARANPQWKHCHGRQVLAIFSGPHAHISAAWYGEKNVVPTWNYVAVHVAGRFQTEESPERVFDILQKTVSFYERDETQPWTMEAADPAWMQRLAEGIVAFSISIESLEGCWKLNQHHSDARREGAIAGLLKRDLGDDRQIAELMRKA